MPRMKKDGTPVKDRTTQIELTHNRVLVKDDYSMWISKKKTVKGEESLERITGYYSTFESLFEGYVREQGKQLKSQDVESALAEFAKLEKDLRRIAKIIGNELDKAVSK